MRTEASSRLEPSSSRYDAANAIDGKPETAWVEGDAGHGLGARLSFFPEEGKLLAWPEFVAITSGYAKSQATWRDNNRPKRLRFVAWHDPEDEPNEPRVFEFSTPRDARPLDPVYFPLTCDCAQDMSCLGFSRFDLEIIDVDPGEKYDDTAISEVAFFGYSAE